MADRTLLAVSLVQASPPLADQISRAKSLGADAVELRVDRIGDVAAVEAVLRAPRDLPLILTIRAAAEGGAWDGGDDERVALYERLGLLLPDYIDVELATWNRSPNLRQKIELVAQPLDSDTTSRPRAALILSHHDFAGTPGDTSAVLDRLNASRGRIVKAVFRASDATDALKTVAELRRATARRPTIVLSMGEAGLIPRVLGPKFGAFLVFAALEAGAEAAPGQPPIQELIERYRWHSIGPATRVYGVVGWPVAHSRSPQIHNAAMAQSGIDGVYLPFPVRPAYDDLARFLDFIDQHSWLDICGLSVTIPHKAHVLRWLDARRGVVTPVARRCGAVNTLIRRPDGTWLGDNTDAPAIRDVLADSLHAQSAPSSPRALVLGAGGVARAAVVALQELGCDVMLSNRAAERAAELAAELGADSCDWAERIRVPADVIVNATSVGMSPRDGETPFPGEAFQPGQVVLDTIYTPPQTRLLAEAAAAGCTTISGEDIFHRQAAGQFLAWHGVKMPRPGA